MAPTPCPFCDLSQSDSGRIFLRNDHAFAIYDKYPVSPGHALVIPHRHLAGYFDLTETERHACWALVEKAKKYLDEQHQPDGYNVGINVGQAAGQTVWHVHIHLIPRYQGDVDNPRGGVRHVVPGKGAY